MRIDHAVRVVESMVADAKGEQAIALGVLVSFAKKVRRSRKAIRQLAQVVDPETHMNQLDLEVDDDG